MEIEDRLSTLGHSHRLAVFRLLMRRYPDFVPAGEIAEALNLKASTLSAQLSALMQVGLLRQSRKGTSVQYSVDMATVQETFDFLYLDCFRGRPDIHTNEARTGADTNNGKFNVLFICVGNSARSIIAETLLRSLAPERFNVYSAGIKPFSELNPIAVQLLEDKGMDVTPLRAKNTWEFQTPDAPVMDFVFTVCDQAANEECAAWQGQPISAHWGLPDPVKVEGTDAEKALAFQQTYAMLRHRIKAFQALPFETLDRIALQKAVDDISKLTPEIDP